MSNAESKVLRFRTEVGYKNWPAQSYDTCLKPMSVPFTRWSPPGEVETETGRTLDVKKLIGLALNRNHATICYRNRSKNKSKCSHRNMMQLNILKSTTAGNYVSMSGTRTSCVRGRPSYPTTFGSMNDSSHKTGNVNYSLL